MEGRPGEHQHRWGLATIVLLALSCRSGQANHSAPEAGTVIFGAENVVEVTQDRVQSGPTLSGTLTAAASASLRAEVPGELEALAERGQRVEAGELLGRIESPLLRSQLESARTAARAAKDALHLARLEEQRTRRLESAGAIARRDLELARQGTAAREAAVAEAEARLATASDQLSRAEVRAPFEGVLSERMANSGDTVAPGTPLFTEVDPSRMTLEASVPGDQISGLEVGVPVDFSVTGYPGELFEGTVDRINPSVDPATRQLRLYASVPNPDGRLRVGLFASGRVATESREALVIPFDAVDTRATSPTVLRVRDGRTERVNIELGLRDEVAEQVEVISGLEEEDQVLKGPARFSAEGLMVELRTASDADGGPIPTPR